MSEIRRRLSALHRAGHARPMPDLYDDLGLNLNARQRPAAVLIAVTERHADDGHGPGVLLIERPSKMRTHGGQVAFPGGGIDAGETPVQAALREANEEIALPPNRVHVIGETDLFNSGSGFAITPVLATVPPDLSLKPNPAEVDEWFEAPLSFVLDPANFEQRSAVYAGMERHYLETWWDGHRIWGVTAAIIANLSRRLRWKADA